MSFTRVEQNGVEFFTLNATGESGMSIDGLAGLCGVPDRAIVAVLQQIAAKEAPSPSLKRFLEKDLYLPVDALSGAKILKSETCMAMISYFAFEAANPTAQAKSSFERFAHMGIEVAIQERLCRELGGQINVRTRIGPLAILTRTEIIAVKWIGDWKAAVEHVITRGLLFPNHRQRVHLFGSPPPDLAQILDCCEGFEIEVTFEPLVLEEMAG
jgi:hypothetical protein